MIKQCEECGAEFEARSHNQRFCKGPHVQTCAICGKEFTYSCTPVDKPQTCSKVCKQKYREQQLLIKYGVTNVSQLDSVRDKKRISNASEESLAKRRATCLARYGVARAIDDPVVYAKYHSALTSEQTQLKRRETFRRNYGVDHVFASPQYRLKYGCNSVSKSDEVKDAIKRKLLDKYGVDNIASIPGVVDKAKLTRQDTMVRKYGTNCIFKTDSFRQHMESIYGVENASQNKQLRSKAARNKKKTSSLEIRLHNFLEAYDIKYVSEHVIKSDNLIHSFDVYLPDYHVLIDCDGEYWHSYISDPDGDRVRDDLDEVRLALVPRDHALVVIVESDFERGLRELQKMLKQMNAGIYDYDSELFRWCRSVGFPYYHYSDDRMIADYAKLCNVETATYNENCRFGLSIINNFHRSIFDAHATSEISPRAAWDDDRLLKQVIANRLIYQNNVNPSKVLQGFNISKIAPKVSVFNPVLAKYLCDTYLTGFDCAVDPFSGFSGRLLGCTAAGLRYVGKDINSTHVRESNSVISLLNLNATVSEEDILQSSVCVSDCMLTCPPYNKKETYGQESEYHTCDEWIDICLAKYHCSKYVFVVDNTSKYVDNVVEELRSKSHFRRSSEYVVVIDKT